MVAAKKPYAQSNRSEPKGSIRSVAQALRVFDYLEECGSEAGVTEVAEVLGVHKSTASRLLATLRAGGYVARNERTGGYSLGIRIMELANTKLEQFDLRTYARPFLEELAQKTNETVHLATMEGRSLVYIDKIDTTHTLAMRSKVGYRIPPHCTALGKAILSLLPKEERKHFLENTKLQRFTPNTITDPQMFEEHLVTIRTLGFATDDQEHEAGIRCVAAAIRDFKNSVVGAISISGPVTRISRQKAEEMGALVKGACLKLSSTLGYKE